MARLCDPRGAARGLRAESSEESSAFAVGPDEQGLLPFDHVDLFRVAVALEPNLEREDVLSRRARCVLELEGAAHGRQRVGDERVFVDEDDTRDVVLLERPLFEDDLQYGRV